MSISTTFAGMVGHLAAAMNRMVHSRHEMMVRACKLVEKEAKDIIGNYQGAAGPFVAWDKLSRYTQEDRQRRGFSADDPLLRNGSLRKAIMHEVTGHGRETKGVVTVRSAMVGSGRNRRNIADIAMWMELGTPSARNPSPPRSFLGMAAVHKEKQVIELLGKDAFKKAFGAGIGL